MCERCAELEERVAWLESELGLQRDAERAALLRARLGLTPAEGAFLMRLYSASGRLVTIAQLGDALPPRDDGDVRDDTNLIRTYVCRVRAKLGDGALLTERALGYRLSRTGLEAVRALLEPTAVAA